MIRSSLSLASLLLLAACGENAPRDPLPRAPLHLVVLGTDREMGLQHGKALATEIAEEVGPRLAARLRAVATDRADAKFLEDACRVYTAKVKPLLSQSLRDELAGIAEGSGVSEDSILLLEVVREGLRFHLDSPPLIEAALASPPFTSLFGEALPVDRTSPPANVVAAWDGAGGRDLAEHALVLERHPSARLATLVVTWPGGLGALAGISSEWILVAEGEVPRTRVEQQTLNGVPFTIGLRAALEGARSMDELFAALPVLSANRVLASRLGGLRRLAVVARVDPSSEGFDEKAWVLAPAGAGGDDPRQRAMDAALGAYPERPKATEAFALATSGRSAGRGVVLRLSEQGIVWTTGSGKPGGDASEYSKFSWNAHPK